MCNAQPLKEKKHVGPWHQKKQHEAINYRPVTFGAIQVLCNAMSGGARYGNVFTWATLYPALFRLNFQIKVA